MTLSFLYGTTLWIAASAASAQLAFPGAMDRAAERVADGFAEVEEAARSTADAPAHLAANADSGEDAASVVDRAIAEAKPAADCLYCDGGHCIVCGQSGFRLDYDACGSHYAGPAFDLPCYASPLSSLTAKVSPPAPRAPEPDVPAAESPAGDEVAATGDATAETDDADEADSPRAGLLASLSDVVDRAVAAVCVRETVSAGAIEASRAWQVTREWLASRRAGDTVPPASREATEKLYDWFASGESPALGAATSRGASAPPSAGETAARPAVTKSFAAATIETRSDEPTGDGDDGPVVAEIDTLVPAEAFAPLASDPSGGAPGEVDWEAVLAEAYLDQVRAAGQVSATAPADRNVEAAAIGVQRVEEDGATERGAVAPAIRSAAVALERLGQAAIELSGRLHDLADGSVVR